MTFLLDRHNDPDPRDLLDPRESRYPCDSFDSRDPCESRDPCNYRGPGDPCFLSFVFLILAARTLHLSSFCDIDGPCCFC